MPMRSEVFDSPPRNITVAKTGAASSRISLLDGIHKSQTGFRSGPLTKEEIDAIKGRPSNYASMLSHMALLEETSRETPFIGYTSHHERIWPVNDRDYTERKHKASGFSLTARFSSYPYTSWSNYSLVGALAISQLQSGHMPALPADSVLQSWAGQMLRNSRPPQVGFDLARFVGEQREAPLLWKVSNYIPTRNSEAAGAILNFVFGLKPTGSDLGKLAELVIRSDTPILRLLGADTIREKRRARRVLLEDSASGEVTLTSYDNTTAGEYLWTGFHQSRVIYPGFFGTSGNYGNVIYPLLRWTYTRKQYLRTFATWEYFVPRPYELEDRLAFYRRKAEMLLSSTKVQEGTVYDLTPWTWLLNWFVDIGGLLRYQRAVVDNQMVMTASGYSTWEEYTGFTTYAGQTISANNGRYPYLKGEVKSFTGVQASIQWRRHRRRASSPYSINPTWTLSRQQWGILSALGLARGAGDLPNIRV